jgi:hypothetical protein
VYGIPENISEANTTFSITARQWTHTLADKGAFSAHVSFPQKGRYTWCEDKVLPKSNHPIKIEGYLDCAPLKGKPYFMITLEYIDFLSTSAPLAAAPIHTTPGKSTLLALQTNFIASSIHTVTTAANSHCRYSYSSDRNSKQPGTTNQHVRSSPDHKLSPLTPLPPLPEKQSASDTQGLMATEDSARDDKDEATAEPPKKYAKTSNGKVMTRWSGTNSGTNSGANSG